MDLLVHVGRVEGMTFRSATGESSTEIRERVVSAVEFGAANGGGLSDAGRAMLTMALNNGVITARGATRLARVARTVADLAAIDEVGDDHVAEAMALRADW
jgi:magnesium chelatase family protein